MPRSALDVKSFMRPSQRMVPAKADPTEARIERALSILTNGREQWMGKQALGWIENIQFLQRTGKRGKKKNGQEGHGLDFKQTKHWTKTGMR